MINLGWWIKFVNFLKKLPSAIRNSIQIFKVAIKANQIIEDYNKQKETIKKYEDAIFRYNLKYNENKREILIKKIKEKYGNDSWGNWWFNDENRLKSVVKYKDKIMYLPRIDYSEHIWKDPGELCVI